MGEGSAEQSFGLNWAVLSIEGTTTVAHDGGTAGFRSFLGLDPQREIGLILWANSTHLLGDLGMHLLNPAVPLSPPGGQVAWSTLVLPTAAALAILLFALRRRSRRRRAAS